MNKRKMFSFVFVSLQLGAFVEYAKWWQAEKQDGRHYVLVSAQWCEPCQKLKKELRGAALANGRDIIVLDVDEHPDLAKKINPSGRIPCLVEYVKAGEKWTMRRWSGQKLNEFLNGE